MKQTLAIACLAGFLALGQVQAQTQDDTVQQPHPEHRNGHGLIEPTSNGSSGSASGTPAGVSDGQDTGTIGSVGTSGGEGSTPPDPYPNAVGENGHIVGGSVTGTGALNSAHPGQ